MLGRPATYERGAIYAIYMSPTTGAIEVTGRIADLYAELGGPGGSGLGFPTARVRTLPDGGRSQRFVDGLIIGPSPRGVHAVREPIRRRTRAPWAVRPDPVATHHRHRDGLGRGGAVEQVPARRRLLEPRPRHGHPQLTAGPPTGDPVFGVRHPGMVHT